MPKLDIDTTYGTTHVIACGNEDNPPLVLFHGVGDDSALMWNYNAKFLSEHYRIYAVDTIGGPGKSVPSVSHGGYLAQLYALHRLERVKKPSAS